MRNEAKNAYSKLTNQQTNANVYNINRNKSNVNNQYKGSVNTLNQSKQSQMQQLPEQMAKLGLYGSGTGETAIGNITNAYAQQLQNLTAQRDNALYDIDTQISNAKAQGQEQLANYAYQMAMQSPQDYLQMLQLKTEEDKYNEATAYGRGRDIRGDFVDDRNYQTNQNIYSDEKLAKENETKYRDSENEYNKLFQKAQILAQSGDFSGFF